MRSWSNKYDRLDRFALPILLAIAGFLFIQVFESGWTYDDFPVIVENPDVRSWVGFLRDSYPGRPLRELTYLVDYNLFGYQPFGWHFQQIFWHGLNGWLVFLLACRLRLPEAAGWAAALLFLCHPLQVEVVANISHRKDSLALAGVLISLICYEKVFVSINKSRIVWLILSAGAAVIAYQAKQTAIVIPLMMFLYEMTCVPSPKRIIARFPKLVGAIGCILCIGTVSWFISLGGCSKFFDAMASILAAKANYFGEVSILVYVFTLLKSWGFIFLKIFIPIRLALEYTFSVTFQMFDPLVWAGISLLGGVVVLAWFLGRRWPPGLFLLGAAILLYLPTSNLWPLVYLAADRYLYAPLAFLSILLGAGLTRFAKHPVLRWLLFATLIIPLCVLTWQQTRVWKSPQTLWENAYEINPDSTFVLNNMGNLALINNQRDNALDFYRRSVAINPSNPTAHYNLGMMAEQDWRFKEAMQHYREFARLNHPQFRKDLEALRIRLKARYGIEL